MHSTGTDHLCVPKDLASNLRYRAWLLAQCRESAGFRAAVLRKCAADFVFWVDSFVWQYNPLKAGQEVGPFICWDFQEEAAQKILWCVRNNRRAVIEKSREMGGTYLCLLVIVWACLFHHNKSFLVISRSADAVDRPGDDKCIFWKIDHLLSHLPEWMKGPGEKPIRRTKMFFHVKRTNSRITGEASTRKAGVGGRATAVFLDEFSQVDEDKEVRARMASTTNCCIFNGTHLGSHTEFYKLCQQPEMVKIQMHWTQHPDKRRGLYQSGVPPLGFKVLDADYQYPPDFSFVKSSRPAGGPFPCLRSPWYDQKSLDIGDSRDVACDLDIDAKGSVSQIVDEVAIRDLIGRWCREPLWRGDLIYDHDSGEPSGLVKNAKGLIQLWMYPDGRGKIPADYYHFGADVSTGHGVTNSCVGGMDRRGKKVVEVATPFMNEVDFAVLSVALCRWFAAPDGEGAQLCWERQGPGERFGAKVVELGYRQLWYRVDRMKLTTAIASVPGWFPSNEAKRALIKDLFESLYTQQFINPSKMAMEETLDWRYDAQGNVAHGGQISCGDPSGAGVNHGDRTIMDGIMWMLVKPHYYAAKKPENQEVKANTLAHRHQMRQDALRQAEQWS